MRLETPAEVRREAAALVVAYWLRARVLEAVYGARHAGEAEQHVASAQAVQELLQAQHPRAHSVSVCPGAPGEIEATVTYMPRLVTVNIGVIEDE